MPRSELVTLIHIVGFVTGISLYGMLGAMTLRRHSAPAADVRASRIPLATALLGLVWNGGALFVYGARDLGLGTPHPLIGAVAAAALGFLPAVVVHAASRGLGSWPGAQVLGPFAYLLSTSAAFALVTGALGATIPTQTVFLTLTIGYGLVVATVLTASLTVRGGARRSAAVVALAAFAFSSFHLSQHQVGESALVAIVGDHASLPLAIVILYQDWRFAFADRFLRRAISLVAIIGVALLLHVVLTLPAIAVARVGEDETLLTTVIHIGLWVGTALLYPPIRRGTDWAVDRILLRRPDYARVQREFATHANGLAEETSVVDATCSVIASALNAERVVTTPSVGAAASGMLVVQDPTHDDAAVLHIPSVHGVSWSVRIDSLGAGRRLLSDDRRFLEGIGLIAGRRIDALHADADRMAHAVREQELAQLAAEAELRALRAQLNPHFLFNALTTIGYLVASSPDRALRTLYRLTELLRAVLRPSSSDFVSLADELELVKAYLDIERERFEERLMVEYDIPDSLADAQILTLVLQPLVENAVKHGISPRREGGHIRISANQHIRNGATQLQIVVYDSGGSFREVSGARRGVGLESVRVRLDRTYGKQAGMTIDSSKESGTTITLWMPFIRSVGERHDLARQFEEKRA